MGSSVASRGLQRADCLTRVQSGDGHENRTRNKADVHATHVRLSSGTTIAVIPFISLQGDLERRRQDVGFDAGRWSGQEARQRADIAGDTRERGDE